MHIASVTSPAVQPQARTPEAGEASGAPDHDGDSDNRSMQAQPTSTAPSATVNGAGQALGQVVNVKA